MTRYICPRCGKITEVEKKEITTRAGDNGFHVQASYVMKCCGFAPFVLPKPYEEGEK